MGVVMVNILKHVHYYVILQSLTSNSQKELLSQTIYLRVLTKPLPNDAKSPLLVDVRRSKTLLLKLTNNH